MTALPWQLVVYNNFPAANFAISKTASPILKDPSMLPTLSQTKMYLWYPKQVVDARAGPGTKSMTKFKSKNKKLCDSGEKRAKKKKEFDREYSPALSDKSDGMQDMEMSEMDFLSEHSRSGPSSRNGSPGNSDCEEQETTNGSRRHKGQARRRENIPEVSSFIDLEYWTK